MTQTSENGGPRLFVSHAGEDADVAIELTNAFTRAGIFAWVDRQRLEIGDSLVMSVQREIGLSTHGVIIISNAFLDKPWPKDELRTIYAQYVSGSKQLLPVWHGNRDEIRYRLDREFPGLSDIWAGDTTDMAKVRDTIVRRVAASPSGSPLYLPSYEDAVHRFFTGVGELITSSGAATSVWETVLLADDFFPVIINGHAYSRERLAATIFEAGYRTTWFSPSLWVGTNGVARVIRLLINDGVPADLLRDQDWPEQAINLALGDSDLAGWGPPDRTDED